MSQREKRDVRPLATGIRSMTGSATQRSRSETSTFRLRDFFTPLPSDVLVVFLAMHCRQPVRMAARRAAVVGTAVALAYSVKDEEGGLASLPERISEKVSLIVPSIVWTQHDIFHAR